MDISLKRTGRLLSSEKPAALRHFITYESGLSRVSASKTSWPQEMPRMFWNFSGRNFHAFCQSWTCMLNLHRFDHPNWGARKQKLVLKRGKVKTPWKQQIWAFFVATFSTIKISQLSTNGHGQPLRASAQNPTRGASLISQLLGFGPR